MVTETMMSKNWEMENNGNKDNKTKAMKLVSQFCGKQF